MSFALVLGNFPRYKPIYLLAHEIGLCQVRVWGRVSPYKQSTFVFQLEWAPFVRQRSMNLQLNDELLSAFLDGEVTAEERQQIEVLLATSPEWQRRYRQLVESVNLVRTLPEEPLPRDFSQGILAQIAQRQQAQQLAEPLVRPAGDLPTDGGGSPSHGGLAGRSFPF